MTVADDRDTSAAQGPLADRNAIRAEGLARYAARAKKEAPKLVVEGRLRRTVGMAMEAEGCFAAVGGRCDVVVEDGRRVETEVVGFAGERLFLMPQGEMRGIVPNARVIPVAGVPEVTVGDDLLGRVLDGRGRPLDGGKIIERKHSVPLVGRPINPLDRQPIREPLDVGVRSINSLLSIGRGQRMGLFAGSGVGKSMLLSMMTRNTNADVVVVGLIGERGREVKEFIDLTLGADTMHKAVVVATPADDTPLMRMHGAWLSAAIAEHFRDQGLPALSVREIAAARGACWQRCSRRRINHGDLHRARGRRRPERPDCRCRAGDSRRPHRAVAQAGGIRPVPGGRR